MFITINLGSIAGRGIRTTLWAIGSACLLSGCASPFDNLQSQLRAQHEAGEFVAAAKTLDEPASKETFGSRNELLWTLDRGGVGLAINDMPTTIRVLEDAERRIDAQRALRPSEQAAQWVLNDTVVPYIAPPYEDIYVNVFKMMAQLELGQVDGGATVEARRMANKANLLRDQYLREDQALRERAGPGYGAAERAGVATRYSTPTGGEFIESPLGIYLTAITFMKTGDRELQRVAGRRLMQSMEAQPKLFPDVNRAAFANVGELDPAAGNVLLVALTGCGPYLEAERVGPMAIFSLPVYFELPRMKLRGSRVVAARIEVQDQSGTVSDIGGMELVENIGSVAAENFRRELPLIYQRTLVRYLVKAGATVGASEVVAQTQNDSNTQWLIRSVGGLIGLAVLGATEKADLRSWEFLPAKAFVGFAKLPPGNFRVRTVYLGAGNVPLGSSAWREVTIPQGPAAGQLATVVQTTAQ